MLKALWLAVCCLLLSVVQTLAEDAKHYQILPFAEKATECHVSEAVNASCVTIEVLILKPNNELATCTATFKTSARTFKFSAVTPAPTCTPIRCSTCDLMPPISPTETRLELYRSLSIFRTPTVDSAMYWGVNEQTGLLTVCAIDSRVAECKTLRP